MISIHKKEGRYAPVVIYDECGKVIDDVLNAVEISSLAPEGTAAQAFHVHKGACDQALSAKLDGLHGSEELAVHLLDLMRTRLAPVILRVRSLLHWSAE